MHFAHRNSEYFSRTGPAPGFCRLPDGRRQPSPTFLSQLPQRPRVNIAALSSRKEEAPIHKIVFCRADGEEQMGRVSRVGKCLPLSPPPLLLLVLVLPTLINCFWAQQSCINESEGAPGGHLAPPGTLSRTRLARRRSCFLRQPCQERELDFPSTRTGCKSPFPVILNGCRTNRI